MRDRMLEGVGITEVEETVYRLLLHRPRARVSDLAKVGSLSRPQVQAAIGSLESAGLISRSAGRSPHFIPAPPDVAIEALILRRQEQLERARLTAKQLTEEFRASGSSSNPADLVEVVTDSNALAMRFEQVQRAAGEEVLILDRPPYAHPALNDIELDLLQRGVTYRVVYDRRSLEYPGQIDWLNRVLSAGEEAKTHPDLPLKLTIVDRRLALVPLTMTQEGVEGAVVVHSSLLLDALIVVFEMIWRSSTVLLAGGQPEESVTSGEVELSAAEQDLLLLLVGGLQDKAIANQLGLGFRTVQGRVARLMDRLGAVSRFQAGWIAAQTKNPGSASDSEAG